MMQLIFNKIVMMREHKSRNIATPYLSVFSPNTEKTDQNNCKYTLFFDAVPNNLQRHV